MSWAQFWVAFSVACCVAALVPLAYGFYLAVALAMSGAEIWEEAFFNEP